MCHIILFNVELQWNVKYILNKISRNQTPTNYITEYEVLLFHLIADRGVAGFLAGAAGPDMYTDALDILL